MDRREFLEASASAAVLAAFPTAVLLTAESYFHVKFTHHYDLDIDKYLLTGAVEIFDGIHTHWIEKYYCTLRLQDNTNNQERKFMEGCIRKALQEQLSGKNNRMGDTIKIPMSEKLRAILLKNRTARFTTLRHEPLMSPSVTSSERT